jgi:hypothetical protein
METAHSLTLDLAIMDRLLSRLIGYLKKRKLLSSDIENYGSYLNHFIHFKDVKKRFFPIFPIFFYHLFCKLRTCCSLMVAMWEREWKVFPALNAAAFETVK